VGDCYWVVRDGRYFEGDRMATNTLASRLFESWRAWQDLEDEFNSAIGKIIGDKKFDMVGNLVFDEYDNSMEFKDCRASFELTPTEELEIYKLGFSIFWVCYNDGKQKYYNEKRPRSQE
jgi:hypothetical protein